MSDVLSGKNLAVTWDGSTVNDVQSVTINDEPNLQAYGSSSTSGRKKRVAGTADLTGSMEIIGTGSGGPQDLFSAGATGTLVVIEDSNNAADHTHTMVVRIGTITANVDANDGTIVSYTVNFEGNGAYTKS